MRYPVIVVPFLKVEGLTLYPFIFVRTRQLRNDQTLMRHEAIHLRQQAELLVVPFYLAYIINYLFNRVRYKEHYRAYRQIVFEREAYLHETDKEYLQHRKFLAWTRLLGK